MSTTPVDRVESWGSTLGLVEVGPERHRDVDRVELQRPEPDHVAARLEADSSPYKDWDPFSCGDLSYYEPSLALNPVLECANKGPALIAEPIVLAASLQTHEGGATTIAGIGGVMDVAYETCAATTCPLRVKALEIGPRTLTGSYVAKDGTAVEYTLEGVRVELKAPLVGTWAEAGGIEFQGTSANFTLSADSVVFGGLRAGGISPVTVSAELRDARRLRDGGLELEFLHRAREGRVECMITAMPTARSRAIEFYLSDALRDAKRGLHRARRALRGGRRELIYVHQVDDPYGLLLLSLLPTLVEAAGLSLRILVIPTPTADFAPDLPRLRPWACADARRLADTHGLAFPAGAQPPAPAVIERALAVAVRSAALPWRARIELLRALGDAVFGAAEWPSIAGTGAADVVATLATNVRRIHRLGHYQGGMLYYEGEWYWGLDRLPLLEARLRGEGVTLAPLLDADATPCVEPSAAAELELFFSFRSPYSYLAFERTRRLAARRGVTLRTRIVLPMVMRGLSVPAMKRLYIARDCRRIAASLGIPYGRIADPLGAGVERCIAVAMLARREGRLEDWIHSATRGIWSEGMELVDDRGLRALAARAGLDGDAALEAARGPQDAWRAEVEDNRRALLDMGLWGVPSFRLGELVLWGQDRVDVLEAALRER
ncbi:MAG: DsbA family protein [Myxococcales bacterium]|nr:DsbA family protein [Myxococcales bacterium]